MADRIHVGDTGVFCFDNNQCWGSDL